MGAPDVAFNGVHRLTGGPYPSNITESQDKVYQFIIDILLTLIRKKDRNVISQCLSWILLLFFL